MAHEEYIRLIHGADTAVLFLHGIVGTPNHFRDLIPLVQAVPEEWSVYNVLLPGHGGSTKDFGRASMKQWKDKVWEVFRDLAERHERVVIVGHSMGALFAMQLAQEYPGKIPCLFLLAAPMRPYLGPSATVNSLRLAFGRVRLDHPREAAIAVACGAEPTLRVWEYLSWIPRFAELFREVRLTEKSMGRLAVPCECWQSGRDELVMASAGRVLAGSGRVQVHLIPDSSHFYYAPRDREVVVRAFRERCAALTK